MPFTTFEPFDDNHKYIFEPCKSSEHNPPSHMFLEPGTYVWTCPSCGKSTVIIVPKITL